MSERRPQAFHTASMMVETRRAKCNTRPNPGWEFDDITDKWERHAFSAFMDLQVAEAEVIRLRDAADAAEKLIVALYDKDAIPTLMQYEVDKVRSKLRAALQPQAEQEQK